jgi:hypothetical protein
VRAHVKAGPSSTESGGLGHKVLDEEKINDSLLIDIALAVFYRRALTESTIVYTSVGDQPDSIVDKKAGRPLF